MGPGVGGVVGVVFGVKGAGLGLEFGVQNWGFLDFWGSGVLGFWSSGVDLVRLERDADGVRLVLLRHHLVPPF